MPKTILIILAATVCALGPTVRKYIQLVKSFPHWQDAIYEFSPKGMQEQHD